MMRLFGGETIITSLAAVQTLKTAEHSTTMDRKFHGFVYKTEGVSRYYFNGKTIELLENELIFLPKHSHYEIRADNGGKFMTFNFEVLTPLPAAEPIKFVFKNHARVLKLFMQIQHISVLKNDPDLLLAKSYVYQIMSEISRQQEAAYISPQAKEKIDRSIQYLRQHLYDANLRVSDLHHMLQMGSTYYRQLFKLVFFMTPIEYIHTQRIEQAKALLVSGHFETIEQVAHAVGFSDVFYFSKVFKSKTGKTPTAWKRQAD